MKNAPDLTPDLVGQVVKVMTIKRTEANSDSLDYNTRQIWVGVMKGYHAAMNSYTINIEGFEKIFITPTLHYTEIDTIE